MKRIYLIPIITFAMSVIACSSASAVSFNINTLSTPNSASAGINDLLSVRRSTQEHFDIRISDEYTSGCLKGSLSQVKFNDNFPNIIQDSYYTFSELMNSSCLNTNQDFPFSLGFTYNSPRYQKNYPYVGGYQFTIGYAASMNDWALDYINDSKKIEVQFEIIGLTDFYNPQTSGCVNDSCPNNDRIKPGFYIVRGSSGNLSSAYDFCNVLSYTENDGEYRLKYSCSRDYGNNTISNLFEFGIETGNSNTGLSYLIHAEKYPLYYDPYNTLSLGNIKVILDNDDTFIDAPANINWSSIYEEITASGSQNAFNLLSIFKNIRITNPLTDLWGMFRSSNSCVNIPTLSGWLHLSSSQVCPLFSASVRNVLTPVFSLSSTMLLFGFIVKWLKSSGGY